MATPTLLNGGQRQFVETYGSALTWNTYLKILSFLLTLLALGLVGLNYRTQARVANLKPLVLRINPDGSARVSTFDEATVYTPQVSEVRFHLKKFAEHFYSRQRATLRRDFTEAIYFLDETYREKILPDRQRRQVYETFRTDPAADDLEVTVDNVTLSELETPPFHAAIYVTKQGYVSGTRTKRGDPVKADVQVEFTILPAAPKWLRDENPIAIQITRLEGFEAFQ